MSIEHAPQQRKVYLTAGQVRARYGGISDMTLFRWIRDPELGFPQPTYINDRRYWEDGPLDEFDAKRAAESQNAKAA